MLVALIAVALTTYTVIQARRTQRTDAFLRLHELMIQPDAQRGRRRLFQAANGVTAMPRPGTVESGEMNRALALYDTLGMYIEHRIVDPESALDAWVNLRNIKEPANRFIDERQTTYRLWPHLSRLFDRAEAHHPRRPCCQPLRIEDRKPCPAGDETRGSPADP